MAGTSFLAGELVTLMHHAREKRAKEARDLIGEKFKTNMAAQGFFSVYETFVLFCNKFAHQRVFDVFNSHCACRRQKQKKKKGDSRRHKGCFASKRKIQSIRNLATAKKERTQVKENLPEEEKDCEPATKIKTRSQQVSHECYIVVAFRLVRLIFVTFSSHLFFF